MYNGIPFIAIPYFRAEVMKAYPRVPKVKSPRSIPPRSQHDECHFSLVADPRLSMLSFVFVVVGPFSNRCESRSGAHPRAFRLWSASSLSRWVAL